MSALVITSDEHTARTLANAGRPTVVVAVFNFGSIGAVALASEGHGSSVMLDAARPDAEMLSAALTKRGIRVDRCDFDALLWSAGLP